MNPLHVFIKYLMDRADYETRMGIRTCLTDCFGVSSKEMYDELRKYPSHERDEIEKNMVVAILTSPEFGFKKKWVHDCDECIPLGGYTGMDLYFCKQGGVPTVIARYGNEGYEYYSGMDIGLPVLQEARERAKILGLI